LIRRYIDEAARREWPLMARQSAALRITPEPLSEVLALALALTPGTKGQEIAQREITTVLGEALEARRQRIIASRSQVNIVKWSCLLVQAMGTLVAIGMIHCDNRLAARIAMGTFATGVAVSLLLIISHDRPFTGDVSVRPDPLLQVMPEIEANQR
jgi:hypothetical protein